jgi:PEP-CTERM motif
MIRLMEWARLQLNCLSSNLQNRGNLMKKAILLSLALSVAMPTTASAATNILYRVDGTLDTDYIAQALMNPLYTVTNTNGNLSSFTLSNFDAVVYANQNFGRPSGDETLLNAYILAGGRVIYQDWTSASTSVFGSAYTGNVNGTSVTLGAGLGGGTLSLTNPGWGIFSRGLSASGGTVAATFGNGDAAIIRANGGRTFHNGFLSDTAGTSSIYSTQLSSLFAGGAVPEPSTWLMMILGFGMVGASMRRRKTNVKVNYSFA